MSIQYIAGRPMSAIGKDGKGKEYNPGDVVDVTNIPHLEALVKARRIYRVWNGTNKAYDELPPTTRATIQRKAAVMERLGLHSTYTTKEAESAQKASSEDLATKIAVAEADMAQARQLMTKDGVLTPDMKKERAAARALDRAKGVVAVSEEKVAEKRPPKARTEPQKGTPAKTEEKPKAAPKTATNKTTTRAKK